MDRDQEILEAIAKAELIRGEAFIAQESLEAIEGARRQLSVAQDELRGQHTRISERVSWLIRELDKLAIKYKALEGK